MQNQKHRGNIELARLKKVKVEEEEEVKEEVERRKKNNLPFVSFWFSTSVMIFHKCCDASLVGHENARR